MRVLIPALGLLWLLSVSAQSPRAEPAAAAAAESGGSCVACHRTASGVSYMDHDFQEWEASRHAAAGVSCAACHGGDPAAKDKKAAHAGVLASTEVYSKVYFTRIPETCGSCHQAEGAAFRKSAHARDLKRSGRGPNCVTCHGSMANHILAPRELERTCTLCHRKPTQAYATLLALNNAAGSLDRLEKAVASARAGGVDAARQERSLREARGLHASALADWHTFKMPEVLRSAQDVTKRSVTALNELQIKEGPHDGTGKP